MTQEKPVTHGPERLLEGKKRMQAIVTDEITAIREQIAQRIGAAPFQIWFHHSTRVTVQDEQVRIAAANSFICQWIQGHFESAIIESAQAVLDRRVSVQYEVDASLSAAAKGAEPSAASRPQIAEVPASEPAPEPRRGAAPLKLSLGTFVVGAKNELAFNAASTVVGQEKSPFNPLFYHGGYGVGKTHLLQGICNEIARTRRGAKWLYVSAEDFANQYVLALKTRRLDAFRARFRSLDVLAIDDIHFLANKNAMQEEFLHTFNSIDLAGKQIVLASDAHPKEISALCDKLVNRFVSGMVVRMEPPDFETRKKIIQQRALELKKPLSDDVAEFIARTVSSNVRELEGALIKLIAFASVSGGRMTLSAAREVLADHILRSDPVVHTSDITSAVAEYFEVRPADIYSARKERTVSLARSMAMYLTRRFTQMSFPEIGRSMGNKNHATVILACRKIEEALDSNAELKWRCPAGCRLVLARDAVSELTEKIS